jgi:hypothetical protein
LSNAIGWAVWHPTRGFMVPHLYEGAVAWADLDGAVRLVRELNADDGTNNRNGWRAVKVELVRVPA